MTRKVQQVEGIESPKVGERLLYYSGGYSKEAQAGEFTTVTAVTKTGRFRIKADGERHLYYPDNLKRIQKSRKWECTPYCRRLDEHSKKAEENCYRRMWINRIKSVNLEECTTDQLKALIGTLNTSGIK